MNELCINTLYHSFYGETDELWHKGKMGMHWGRRYYQPYSQGYQAQNKGIFYGTIGKLRGLTSKAKGIGKYYTSGEGGRDLMEGFKEIGKKAKGFADRKGVTDTVSQLGSFGKEVGRRAKDTAIPFLREAGSELGKKAKKGLMTAATYGIYGARELGKMGKEQIERGKTYLDAFSKTGTGQELVSRITAAKKGAKNAYDKGIDAATSLGASILSAYIGGPKGRSYEEYSRPKAKSDLAYGLRTLTDIGEGKSKRSSKSVKPDYDSWVRSEYSLAPIDQEHKYDIRKPTNYWHRATNTYDIPSSTKYGRERALDAFTRAAKQNNNFITRSGSAYDTLLDRARGFAMPVSGSPEQTKAKNLLNQLTTLSGGRTIDSVNAERWRTMKDLLPYTSRDSIGSPSRKSSKTGYTKSKRAPGGSYILETGSESPRRIWLDELGVDSTKRRH